MNWARAVKCASALLSVLAASQARAEMGPAVPPDKKIVMWAPSALRPDNLREHITDLGKENPGLDGLIIHFWPNDWTWKHMGGNHGQFVPRRYSPADFSDTVRHLQAADMGHIQENFLLVKTTVQAKPGKPPTAEESVNIDWFDERWPIIAENVGVYASVARAAGFKGLMLDFEEYQADHNPLYKYFYHKVFKDYRERNGLAPKSLAEYLAQVRQCGRQMMAAITKAYPDITMFMIPDTGWVGHRHYDLLPAFVDGILEGAGPRVKLIDGIEQGYPKQTYAEFMQLRQTAEKEGPRLSAMPELYRRRMMFGCSIWVDYKPEVFGGWHTARDELEQNFRSPVRLEHALYNALTATDKYVFLYVCHPDYWYKPRTRKNPAEIHVFHRNRCRLCPHGAMPQAYLDAFVNCRRPHDLGWVSPVSPRGPVWEYTEEDMIAIGPNLIENGTFEAWSAGPEKAPDGWDARARGPFRVSRVQEGAKSGKYALELSRPEEGGMLIDQALPAEPYRGKTIVLGAWCKTGADAECDLQVNCKIRGRWVGICSGAAPQDGRWHFMTTGQTIDERAEAIRLQIFLVAETPHAAGRFDNAIAVVVE